MHLTRVFYEQICFPHHQNHSQLSLIGKYAQVSIILSHPDNPITFSFFYKKKKTVGNKAICQLPNLVVIQWYIFSEIRPFTKKIHLHRGCNNWPCFHMGLCSMLIQNDRHSGTFPNTILTKFLIQKNVYYHIMQNQWKVFFIFLFWMVRRIDAVTYFPTTDHWHPKKTWLAQTNINSFYL